MIEWAIEESIMSQIEAMYQNSVSKPLGSVGLAVIQRVRLNVEPLDTDDDLAWLAREQ